jgi:uncharacterized protein (DUF2384 family)
VNDSFRRRRREGVILSPDEGKRQGRVVRAAHILGDVETVRAFLNTPHEALGGRPLDLAIASEAGLIAVESAIAAERAGGPFPGPAAEQENRR